MVRFKRPERFAPASRRILTAMLATMAIADARAATLARPVTANDAPAASAASPSRSGTARPRIGLVLGGGGAKGAAHVGVLTLLEDMRIPIDCVIGTSMGALVGGTYAAGMSAAEMERAIRKISWSETIGYTGRREKLPMRRKLAGETYSNGFEFGVRDRGITAPTGFIRTQNIEQQIRSLVARGLGTARFDELPIPFRAIATDMQTGEMVVLDHGDLARALRASMAVPGIFAPVRIEGRILGDGGLTRNVPVDIARQTCADVVIAVAVPNPPPDEAELSSPLSMIEQTIDVLIGANEKQQLDTLGPDDVKIVVPMGEISSGSFDRVADAVPLGRRTAELHREELRRYSLPEAEYRTWRERSLRPEPRSLVLADVRVEGTDRVNPEFVRMKLDIAPGQEVRERDIATAVARLFDSDDFDSVDYSFAGDWERPTLVVSVHEKSQSPNIVRFDLGLAMGSGGANAFALSADYLRPWINSLGGEVHGTLQFGRTSHAQLSLYQPVDPAHAWFVEPGVRIAQSREDIYVEDTAATRYVLDTAYGYLDVGRSFGSHAELRAGVRAGVQGAEREIVAPGFASLDTEAYGGLALAYTYDDRDRELLATRGWLSRVHYFRSIDALSAQPDYDRLEAMLERSLPLWGNVLELRATGGANFDGELPVYDYFVLGGPVSFPGLGIGQLRGTSYWSGSALYLHKIADLSPLFGQALYFGAQLNVGDMSGRIDGVREDTIFGGSLLVGGRTPLGPMRFAVSLTSTNEWSVLFALGRPIEERTITDPPW